MGHASKPTIRSTITCFILLILPSPLLTATGKLQSGSRLALIQMLPTMSTGSGGTFCFIPFLPRILFDQNPQPSVLASAQSNITSNTYNMLTRITTWPAFSNHTVGDGGSTSNSLEGIHDGIHVDVGGRGQMADPSVAGEYSHVQIT